MYAAVDIGEVSRNQVRDRLDDAEAYDEGDDDRVVGPFEIMRFAIPVGRLTAAHTLNLAYYGTA
jgi:hypothetical protein